MSTQEENRKITLDHMIDEKFVEIYFLAKEEFEIESNTTDEQSLYEFLEQFKIKKKSLIYFVLYLC